MSFNGDEEALLSRFRNWLHAANQEADALQGEPQDMGEAAASPDRTDGRAGGFPEAPAETPSMDLVEQFTALRHEVKLQTKASRSVAEENQSLAAALRLAVETFESVEPNEAEAAARLARPLVEAIINLDESLQRGRKMIETTRTKILQQTPMAARDELDRRFIRKSWFKRTFLAPWRRTTEDICLSGPLNEHRQVLSSLAEGYDLIVNRLKRAMRESQVERMECVGHQVDPQTMTVIEVVDDPKRPSGEVVEEIRPGYWYRGEVFRFAQVKAVSRRAEPPPEEAAAPAPIGAADDAQPAASENPVAEEGFAEEGFAQEEVAEEEAHAQAIPNTEVGEHEEFGDDEEDFDYDSEDDVESDEPYFTAPPEDPSSSDAGRHDRSGSESLQPPKSMDLPDSLWPPRDSRNR